MIRLLQKSALYLTLVLCTLVIARAAGVVDEVEARRVATSLAIFPRIVAVDTHIEGKVDVEGVLHLAIVYVAEKNFATEQAAKLADAVPNIAGRPVKAHPLPLSELPQWYKAPLGGMLVTEKLSDKQLGEILAEAKRNHLIIFSPFAGDVERGAMAGLAVGSQIKPYFNVRSLREAKIEINPVLLRMSKQYE